MPKHFFRTRLQAGRQGFTLVELLVVIAIIGLLVAIVIPNLSNAKALGRDARRVSDIKNIQLALALYYNDNLQYPLSLDTLKTGGYMSSVPKDPRNSSTDYYYKVYRADKASSNCSTNLPAVYHLGAAMEVAGSNLVNGQDDDVTTLGSAASTPPFCTGNTGNNFNGNADSCVGYTAVLTQAQENCYDVTNPS